MSTVEILFVVTIITFFGSILQASVGFGFGLVVVPLLILVNPNFVPVPLIFASLALMFYVSTKNKFAMDGHSIRYLLYGLALGAPIGAFVLWTINGPTFVYIVCSLVCIGLIASFLKVKAPITPKTQFFAGLAANIFGTSVGIGGLPIALLYQNESNAKIRAVLSTTFFVGGLFSGFALIISKQVSFDALRMTALLLPGIIIGAFSGNTIAKHLNEGFSRLAILFLSSSSMLYLLYKTVLNNI